MAQQLKRQFELTALKISVRPGQSGIEAHAELESHEGGSPRILNEWWLSSSELGLPSRVTADWKPGPALPPEFVAELAQALQELDMDPSHPLWLHLVKPYGNLGALPWELSLVPGLKRPVLRLPDFLEPPRENRAVLEVALCFSDLVSGPNTDQVGLLKEIADAILRGSRRARTSIHVFADELYFENLREYFANEPRMVVHNPIASRRYETNAQSDDLSDETGALRSPWLLWMRDSMRGRSLDAVHFVCDGSLADERSALALPKSPLRRRDRSDACYVGVAELAKFLTQTGAWSALFSELPSNNSNAGLRMLADALAQARPGPVVHHDVHLVDSSELEDLYGFLYAPEPSPVPLQKSWFAYCQPAIVDTQAPVPGQLGSGLSAINSNAALLGAWEHSSGLDPSAAQPAESGLEQVPNWVSASQRYVEQVSLDLHRSQGAFGSANSVRSTVADETLLSLQAIVSQAALTQRDGEDR